MTPNAQKSYSVETRHMTYTFFTFFQGGSRPPSCAAYFGTTREEYLEIFINVQKFGWNGCSSFHIAKARIFCQFGLKTPIHAP